MRFNLVTTWITLASIFIGTCLGYILNVLPSWTQEHGMLQFIGGYVGWITFYVAVGGLLFGLCLLGFGIWYLHKYESQLKQDARHVAGKTNEIFMPPNNETIAKGKIGLTEAISALALLAVVAFIFSRRKKG